ncbi:MAG: energy-coupling factor transporter transmembrane protein EcfT [Clostridia bacterium]|nr:energy-coupling factor transporter transmembrane protein EcfT [Clostridia bacterium]MBQ8739832.1 energy-coupling factor transporter transmembrane protein EcfT [Clostridia bacterium]
MSFDVTIGQYYETNSVIHRLDPRTKLFFVVMYIVSIFVAKEVYAFAFLTAILILTVIISRVPLRIIFSGLKPITVIILFTAVLNMFLTVAQSEPIFSVTVIPNFWTLTLYKEGLYNAGLLALRIILLLLETSIFFSYATTPIELTDGLELSLAPLKAIKVPVHEFAMMMTIALRFIPTLVDETSKIMNAQKARGADFSSGGLIKRAKALIPIIIPLFISSFRRAEELATAMECRCYHGGNGRTRMKQLKMKARDYVGLFLACAFLAGVILLNIYTNVYSI